MNLVSFYAVKTNIAVPKSDCKEKIGSEKRKLFVIVS
jgi:hypothetical protein